MSSLRNAVQRRNHKERAQPHSRQKWGILEKHKDYALRAQDHNVKKRKIKELRTKAAARNDDEFYFGMLFTQSSNGQKTGDRGNKSMGHEEVTGLKRQDAVYLRTMLQVVRREMAKLEEEVQLLESAKGGAEVVTLRSDGGRNGRGSHTVFVDDVDGQDDFDAVEWFGTDETGLNRGFNRPRRTSEKATIKVSDDEKAQGFSRKRQITADEEARQVKREEKKRLQAQEVRKRRLELLRTQEKDLVEAERQLDLQRANMGGTSTTGVTKKGATFKIRERKR